MVYLLELSLTPVQECIGALKEACRDCSEVLLAARVPTQTQANMSIRTLRMDERGA